MAGYGEVQRIEPGLRCVLAPNPSPFTGAGTNTYLVGEGDVAVIDPGPRDTRHLDALLCALSPGERIVRIIVTHAHLDHSALARDLSARVGAPVLGFGPATAGRSATMARLAAAGLAGGGEGVDATFVPDQVLGEADAVDGDGWRLTALHTPGHFAGHLCLAWGDRLFSGDLVMGWATSLVSPPDGDMAAYMASLHRLGQGRWARLYPGHGAPVADAADRIDALIAHRKTREAALLAAMADGPLALPSITARVYADTPASLHPAAARNALAHLIALCEDGRAMATPTLGEDAVFHLGKI